METPQNLQDDSAQTEPEVLLSREFLLSRLLEKIWHVLAAVSLIAGIASVLRFRFTGWLPIYNLHIGIILFFGLCWFLREKIPFNLRVAIILIIFYVVGISGLFSFGLLSAGIWWLILCAMIASMFYSVRTGLIHGAVCLGIILAAGVAVTGGYVEVPFDANAYITEPSTWITLMVGCVALSMFIISAVITYQRAILNLLQEVDQSKKQKVQLLEEQQRALDEISALRNIIPICSSCRKVRDDDGFWEDVDAYMHKRVDIQFSHGMCPDCGQMLYGGVWNEVTDKPGKPE